MHKDKAIEKPLKAIDKNSMKERRVFDSNKDHRKECERDGDRYTAKPLTERERSRVVGGLAWGCNTRAGCKLELFLLLTEEGLFSVIDAQMRNSRVLYPKMKELGKLGL
uniref:Transcriptional regulator n=1 Tax=Bursaphelenchus xylophilus TaxID=6326 RepID=A0A1I7RH67_BURXY